MIFFFRLTLIRNFNWKTILFAISVTINCRGNRQLLNSWKAYWIKADLLSLKSEKKTGNTTSMTSNTCAVIKSSADRFVEKLSKLRVCKFKIFKLMRSTQTESTFGYTFNIFEEMEISLKTTFMWAFKVTMKGLGLFCYILRHIPLNWGFLLYFTITKFWKLHTFWIISNISADI